MKRYAIIILLLALILIVGCGTKGADKPVVTDAPASDVPASDAPVADTAAPTEDPAANTDGDTEFAFTFAAKTLDGSETVTESFFSDYDLTVINVWTTWCPSCLEEMHDLGVLYKQLPENVGFLSVCIDAGDSERLRDSAKKTISDNECEFKVLIPDRGMNKALINGIQYIPTTIFVDSYGNVVGSWVVGVPQGSTIPEAYMEHINDRLESLGQ